MSPNLVFITVAGLAAAAVVPSATASGPGAAEPIFEVIDVQPEPCVTLGSPGTEGNQYGFEGGRALRHGGAYHVFTTEMWGRPIWTRTRLAHWKSDDGIEWERMSTVFESTGNFTGQDTHAALWSPMPTWDDERGSWRPPEVRLHGVRTAATGPSPSPSTSTSTPIVGGASPARPSV